MQDAEYFDGVAAEWDAMRSQLFPEEVREAALGIAAVRAGGTAADIGAGTGFVTEALLESGLFVIAVDHSAGMLEQLRGKFGASERLQLRKGESDRLPIDDGAVDYVFANMYLHHVESPADAIREMVRILRPSGVVVVTDADEHEHEFLRTEQHDRWLGFRHDDVHRWLREAGLTDVAVRGIGLECRPTSRCGGKTAAIRIFAASGRKERPS